VAQTRRQSSTMTIQKFSLKETKLQTKHVSLLGMNCQMEGLPELKDEEISSIFIIIREVKAKLTSERQQYGVKGLLHGITQL